jgi:hypothetical protein
MMPLSKPKIIDMGLHDVACVADFKERQAVAVTARMTTEHQPTMVREMEGIRDAFRTMSNQLFVQAFLTMRLVIKTCDTAQLYYVQRSPQELGSFTWVIDRKDHDLTTMEKTWSKFILPQGETESAGKPARRLIDCDYSHFAKYEVHEPTASPDWARKMRWMRETHGLKHPPGQLRVINWQKLLSEDRTFEDSAKSLGLQLADITATSLRRALNGNLQQAGWEGFGRLFIHKNDELPFCMIGSTPRKTRLEPPARDVWGILSRHARNMIL